jgi:hypothetical protein
VAHNKRNSLCKRRITARLNILSLPRECGAPEDWDVGIESHDQLFDIHRDENTHLMSFSTAKHRSLAVMMAAMIPARRMRRLGRPGPCQCPSAELFGIWSVYGDLEAKSRIVAVLSTSVGSERALGDSRAIPAAPARIASHPGVGKSFSHVQLHMCLQINFGRVQQISNYSDQKNQTKR